MIRRYLSCFLPAAVCFLPYFPSLRLRVSAVQKICFPSLDNARTLDTIALASAANRRAGRESSRHSPSAAAGAGCPRRRANALKNRVSRSDCLLPLSALSRVPTTTYRTVLWQFKSRSLHPEQDAAQPARLFPVLPIVLVLTPWLPQTKKRKRFGSKPEANRKHFGSAQKSKSCVSLEENLASSSTSASAQEKKFWRSEARAICGSAQRMSTAW
jgi:hypothetical protein